MRHNHTDGHTLVYSVPVVGVDFVDSHHPFLVRSNEWE